MHTGRYPKYNTYKIQKKNILNTDRYHFGSILNAKKNSLLPKTYSAFHILTQIHTDIYILYLVDM